MNMSYIYLDAMNMFYIYLDAMNMFYIYLDAIDQPYDYHSCYQNISVPKITLRGLLAHAMVVATQRQTTSTRDAIHKMVYGS